VPVQAGSGRRGPECVGQLTGTGEELRVREQPQATGVVQVHVRGDDVGDLVGAVPQRLDLTIDALLLGERDADLLRELAEHAARVPHGLGGEPGVEEQQAAVVLDQVARRRNGQLTWPPIIMMPTSSV
jgi:hypothetical protein